MMKIIFHTADYHHSKRAQYLACCCVKIMNMKKNFYTVILLVMIANIAKAQNIKGIAGFIQSGYLNTPNTKIFNQAYPDNTAGFANNYFLIGAEAFYREKNNVFMGDWQFGLQKIYSFNNERAGAVYEAILGKYGWIVKEKDNFWLYPSVGAGASVISLTSYTVNDGVRENTRTQTLISPAFDIGMNADFLLSKLKWKDNFYIGWIIGIKAGYRVSIKSNNWSNTDAEFYKLNEMPSYANNAFYVTLSFGGGSFDKR